LSFPDSVARGDVSLTNGAVVDVTGKKGGDIGITAGNIQMTGNSELQGGTFAKVGLPGSQSGDINLNATGAIELDASKIDNSVEIGNAGDTDIKTGSLNLTNGAQLTNSTSGFGNAGNVTVNASDRISLDASNIFSTVRSGATGNAGNIELNAGTLSLNKDSVLTNSTSGFGNAGNITIKVERDASFSGGNEIVRSGVQSNVESGAIGNGGQIRIETGSLNLNEGAQIQTLVREADLSKNLAAGEGIAGNVIVNARDAVTLDGISENEQFPSAIFSSLGSGAIGNAGNIELNAKTFSLTNGAQLTNSTSGFGNAGNVTVNVGDRISLDAGALINSSTYGKGNAGNVTINATESVELSGEVRDQNGKTTSPGGLFADVSTGGQGKGGNLTINTKRLSVSDGSKVQASTFGEGDSGDLTIRASDIDVFETPIYNVYSTGIFAEVSQAINPDSPDIILAKGKGKAGNLTIETERLRIKDGGQVSTSTYNEGNAGTLTVKASDSIEVSGKIQNANELISPKGESFLAAEVKKGATGRGGNLKIETGTLKIANEARISVSSLDESGTAGNLDIKADSIQLDRGTITAATAAGEGGNINLTFDDTLKMRNNSRISAQASNNANGGNVTINADDGFIVAYPNQNNDIVANATQGDGGKIDINSQRIFGLQERKSNPPNQTNDIDASSEFKRSGSVNIKNLDVNPSGEVIQSPQNTVEPDEIVAQACGAGSNGELINSFTVTGRGGLPHSPTEPLNSEAVRVSGGQGSGGAEVQGSGGAEVQGSGGAEEVKTSNRKVSSDEIIPARGIAINEKGQIVLTRYPTPNTPQRTTVPQQPNCSSSLTVEEFLAMDIKEHELDEWLDKEPVKSFLTDMLHSFIEEQEMKYS
jgi:large exoprotein involved in heme utilization and adhesion